MFVAYIIGEVFRFFVLKLIVDEPIVDSSHVQKFQLSRIKNKQQFLLTVLQRLPFTRAPQRFFPFEKLSFGGRQSKNKLKIKIKTPQKSRVCFKYLQSMV